MVNTSFLRSAEKINLVAPFMSFMYKVISKTIIQYIILPFAPTCKI